MSSKYIAVTKKRKNSSNPGNIIPSNFLECPICYDIAEKAVETQCCHKIFCEECVNELKQAGGIKACCPLCRKSPIMTIPSILARRMIDTLPIQCPFECNAYLNRGNLESHLKTCPNRIIECSAANCNFNGKVVEYLKHITQSHADLVIHSFDFCNNNTEIAKKMNAKKNGNDDDSKEENDEDDPIATRRNSRGSAARLGITGKYYCGQLQQASCTCCNGYCGPGNGCNCYSCMELDIKHRGLSKGYLVNRDGFTSRISVETGKFYCGRKVGRNALGPWCDGYCGPTNGPNCRSCQKLDIYSKTKYSAFM